MSRLKCLSLSCLSVVCILSTPRTLFAQYTVSTIAGGGPNNLAATVSSIGLPSSMAFDSAGNTYIADSYSSHIYKVDTNNNLTVVAGDGTMGYAGDGGPAASATLNRPQGVYVDGSGNIFIADTDNSVIREVVASTGNIQTVAGNGMAGYAGDGGLATSAELYDPYGVFVDGSGNIFIADTDNSVIREVVASTGNIQTVAGNGTAGYGGDGTPATSAMLDEPEGVFVDSAENIYVADTFNSVIREVLSTNGQIQTVAGTYYNWASTDVCNYSGDGLAATSAQLCLPGGLYLVSGSTLLIADTQNSVIRAVNLGGSTVTVAGISVPAGAIETVAGNGTAGYSGDGTAATSAQLNSPNGVVVDSSGDIFIADMENSVIREIASSTTNLIATVIGNTSLAYSGDGAPATSAELNYPGQVSLDASGNVYIADTENSVIRVVNTGTAAVTIAGVTIQPGNIATVAGNGTASYTGDGGASTAATLNLPYGVFVDSSGDIFIADTENSAIREVVASTGNIQTVAGTGTACSTPSQGCGDGGPASSATLDNPYGVVVDSSGNIYIADTENSVTRVVNTGTSSITIAGVAIAAGNIQTVAGTMGTACADPSTGCGDGGAAISGELNFPGGISLDSSGDIFIADTYNDVVREVTGSGTSAGTIQTVAGIMGKPGYAGDNGAPTSAQLYEPRGVTIDSSGDILIADTDNAALRSVEVLASPVVIATIAGDGTPGFSGDGGSSTSAELNSPYGVAISTSGTVFIADTVNSRIRESVSTASVSVVPSVATVPVGTSGTQQFAASVSTTSSSSSSISGSSVRSRKVAQVSQQQVTSVVNSSVTWQVNGITGGNSTFGTISASGLYQAPMAIPSSSITVTAISNANGLTSGSAKVILAGAGTAAITVSTSPAGVTDVYTGTSQSFNATVTGGSTAGGSTAVNWQVNCVGGGNSNCGTITSAGAYSAPATVPSNSLILVTAVLQANSAVTGSYPFSLVTAPTAASPASQTISPGQSATYRLSLNANTGDRRQPITLSCVQSSLPLNATCTFTPPAITPSTEAVPFSLVVAVPTGTTSASKQGPSNSLFVSQFCHSVTPLASVLLLVGFSRKKRARWLWLALLVLIPIEMTACGGGGSSSGTNPEAGTYTMQIQGTTAAQPTPITITTAGLTVE